MIKTAVFNKTNMYKAAKGGFTNATDAADWLVKKGVPFRDAHAILGHLVLYCINNDKGLEDLTLDEFRAISPVFDESVYEAISVEKCVEARSIPGGPSPEYIKKLIEQNKEYINSIKD